MNKLRAYPNNNLGNGVFKALTFSDFSTSDDIKLVCQKMFSALPTSGICYRVRMKPTPSGTTADAYVYCASSNYGFVHIRDHGGTDYYGRVQNGTWTWDSYALKSDLPKYNIKTITVDVTTKNANSNRKYYTEKKLSTESWYSSAKAIVPLFARKSGGAYICMAEIEYEMLRVQADIAISGVTVGILVVF